ncbi:CLUMA_CG001642, isoform A [Clunio marinus]|uniref:CLUMA_CG001642, isoform A n=1 Tax=Clunio marinus TaxID=568069 RepID=A0A1J1HII8_9DIPT|nr:CLUMA_CG001642, isoform A [Clunio marinus]
MENEGKFTNHDTQIINKNCMKKEIEIHQYDNAIMSPSTVGKCDDDKQKLMRLNKLLACNFITVNSLEVFNCIHLNSSYK